MASGRNDEMISVDGYGECVLIGRGGVGEVYRSTRLSTGAVVAIKVLHQVTDESAAWRRTRRELAAMVALAGHAHVIGVIEVLDLPAGPALVMEYAPGGSVGDLIARRATPLSVGEAVLIGEHASKALIAAHARGIVHRDIKPQNLLIDAFGQVKLCDFGIASLARSHEFCQHTNSVSLRYASPEDLEGDDTVGPKTDIYSLGATLLHLVHGAPPSLRDRTASWEPPPGAPSSDVAAINAVIAECLRVDPADRPEASEVLGLLECLSSSGSARCRAIVSASPALAPAPRPFSACTDNAPSVSAELIEALPEPTVARPSRLNSARVPDAEPAPLTPGWRRNSIIAAPIVVLVVVLAALFLWQRPRPADSVTSVDRPTDLVELTLMVWPEGRAGECLVQPPTGDTLEMVECSAPHDLQRVDAGELTAGDTSSGTTEDLVDQRCTDVWQALVEDHRMVLPPDVADVLHLSNVRPADDVTSAGPAAYQCFVGVPGRRLVGDVTGSARMHSQP